MKEIFKNEERKKYIESLLILTQKAIVMYLILLLGMYLFYWLGIYTPLLKISALFIFVCVLYDESKKSVKQVNETKKMNTLKIFIPSLFFSLLLIGACNKLVGVKAPVQSQTSAYDFNNKQ